MSSCLFRKVSHLSCHGVGTWGDGLKDFYGRLTKENNNELQLGRLDSLPSLGFPINKNKQPTHENFMFGLCCLPYAQPNETIHTGSTAFFSLLRYDVNSSSASSAVASAFSRLLSGSATGLSSSSLALPLLPVQ